MFAKVEFKLLLAVVIGRFELKQDGGERPLLGAARRGTLVSVKGVIWAEFSIYFVNIVCYQGMKEGWKDGRNAWDHVWLITRGHSTLSPLSYL